MINLIALAADQSVVRIGNNIFRKQLLRFGRWIYPADHSKYFEVDRSLCDRLVNNFNLANFNDYIPVFMAADQSEPHKVMPTDTVGRIVGLQVDKDGLYSLIEFGTPELSDKAAKNLIPGVSAGIALDYMHKQTGQNVGPVLKHVVLCNEPYIKNLRGFEKVELAEQPWDIIEFAEVQRTAMKREQLEAIAKKLGVDPTKFSTDELLLAEIMKAQDVTVHLAEVTTLKTNLATLTTERDTLKTESEKLKTKLPETDKSVIELSEKLKTAETSVTSLTNKVTELELANKKTSAAGVVDGFITKGQIVPAQRESLIELAVSNKTLFDTLYNSTSPVIVKLGEQGVVNSGSPMNTKMDGASVKAEVERLEKLHLTSARR